MRIGDAANPLHLTYCLNIHPGEHWADVLGAVRGHACEVRNRLGWTGPFGLGLRLGSVAAHELMEAGRLAEFKVFLAAEGLYVFTLNGFPYGRFHGTRVKEKVYAPDWASTERQDYTAWLTCILAELLPEGVAGSISTVPGAYRTSRGQGAAAHDNILLGLGRAAAACDEVFRETGRHIRIAIEPEPDCLWDTTDQVIELFTRDLPGRGATLLAGDLLIEEPAARQILGAHLGVCLDVCHQAVLFERPAESLRRLLAAGVPVAKIQVSAAPTCRTTPAALRQLRAFVDPVYLHQSCLRDARGGLRRFADLPEALAAAGDAGPECELRTHFHIPLCVAKAGSLGSTRRLLDRRFFDLVRGGASPHIEVETYTFDVLPEGLRRHGVDDNIVAELRWILAKLGGTDSQPGAHPAKTDV